MKVKSLIATSVLAASAVTSSVAMAESPWSANIGVGSNYMWRGITQTDNAAAISGGVDYANPNGFYAGTWTSNVTWVGDSYELDLYAGYGSTWVPLHGTSVISSTCIRRLIPTTSVKPM